MRQRKPNARPRKQVTNNRVDGTERIIIVAILILALALLGFIGVYAYQNFLPSRGFHSGGGFSGGGGGGGTNSSSPEDNTDSNSFSLEASVHELEVNTADDTVYFYAKPTGSVTTVELTDDSGNVLTEMKDDGLYSESGDDLSNDGIFTAKIKIDVTQEQALYFSAIVDSNISEKSNVEKIVVLTKLTQSELSDIRKVNDTLETMRESDDYKQLAIDERKTRALEKLSELSEAGLIKNETICVDEDSHTITYYYSSGVIGMEMLEEFSPVYAGNGISKGMRFGQIKEYYGNNSSTQTQITANLGDATILYAWGDPSADPWNTIFSICKELQKNWNDLGFDTTLDSDVTINDMKGIKDKSFVYIAAHGVYSTFHYEYNQKYWFVFKTESTTETVTAPGVFLLEKSTDSKNSEYSSGLKTGRIVISNGKYGIVPSFFDEYYKSGDFDNTILFWGSCQLMGKKGDVKEDWTKVLNKKSIKAFVGFHNSNYIAYHFSLLDEMVPALIQGKTINDALTMATNKYGTDDVQWYNSTHEDDFWDKVQQFFKGAMHPHSDAAYPLLRGDSNATLINSKLINGNFELDSATLKGWKKTGDVRLITQLGDISPKEGAQMAILTTGIGSGQSTYLNSTEGSSLYQAVKLDSGAKKLSLTYNIISEEPTEYIGSGYDDKFFVEVLNAHGEVLKIAANETVNSSTWIPVNGIDFEDGDDTVYQTGWKNVECDLSDLQDQIITIRFVVFDVGDSLFDTAAVVDNVRLE